MKGVNMVGEYGIKRDSLSEVEVPSEKLWGSQSQPYRENFISGSDLILEMILYYPTLKKASSMFIFKSSRLKHRNS